MNKQQKETKNYFSRNALTWQLKAQAGEHARVNVIEQRNQFVNRVAMNRSSLERALDVGCGTGELVLELARLGVTAVGIDFAPEMIEICKQKAAGLDQTKLEFIESSIFDYKPNGLKFDLISANGFIEYVSEQQLLSFISQARSLLRPGGSFVVGSRNRLFNIFSLNEYTQAEIEKGTLENLTSEAMVFHKVATVNEAIDELRGRKNIFPVINCPPTTGVSVEERYQYTPGQLIRRVSAAGFECTEIHPINFHGGPPRFVREHPEVHVIMADMMQSYESDCHSLIPFSSSFMLHAIRL